jgi:hypothetical protein
MPINITQAGAGAFGLKHMEAQNYPAPIMAPDQD